MMKTFTFGQSPVRLEIAGSTNTYARQLIESARPDNGTVITSAFQYSGRGQGNHKWESESGKNLLCSYIFYPEIPVNQIFLLNKMIACAVHQCLEKLIGNNKGLKIKWPNDILIQNRKIAGLLIETGIKGEELSYCIAGIGINVNQEIFRTFHPEAVSIKMLTGKHTDLDLVLGTLNKSLSYYNEVLINHSEEIYEYFHRHLYLLDQLSDFMVEGNRISATIIRADNDGYLNLKTADRETLKLQHGHIQYIF